VVKKRDRAAVPAPIPPKPEETEFVEGVLVSYYDEGTRYGFVLDSDIDDDGDILCRVQPIGARGAAKQRAKSFKTKDLVLEKGK
jgi:hypothetical protein